MQIQGLRNKTNTKHLECALGTKWTSWDTLSKLYKRHVCEEPRTSGEPAAQSACE
ncbi:hypothetical protein I79_012536 [Cricetulus griseus]|uniref:Uncharacterized protein n=1 Tax=Cricetulus griseus TaxID=10029 RepID=G3HP32_CRIGR|nr:hypothetical protein I79_012536 [Cricetulus griseus]